MNLEQLKTELTEFIEMSSKATPGEWIHGTLTEYHMVYDTDCARHIARLNGLGLAEENATFIARSRNISPKMAEMLLATIELMDDMPFSVADALEEKLLNLW